MPGSSRRGIGLLRRGMLMAVPFDARRLQVSGAPVGLAIADVMQAANIQPIQIDTGAGQFAVSDSGSWSTRPVASTRRTDGRWSGSIARAGRKPSASLPDRTRPASFAGRPASGVQLVDR